MMEYNKNLNSIILSQDIIPYVCVCVCDKIEMMNLFHFHKMP